MVECSQESPVFEGIFHIPGFGLRFCRSNPSSTLSTLCTNCHKCSATAPSSPCPRLRPQGRARSERAAGVYPQPQQSQAAQKGTMCMDVESCMLKAQTQRLSPRILPTAIEGVIPALEIWCLNTAARTLLEIREPLPLHKFQQTPRGAVTCTSSSHTRAETLEFNGDRELMIVMSAAWNTVSVFR